MRSATITRKTTETEISCTVNLDGTGQFDIKTGVGFFDHMMEQVSRHSLIDIKLMAKGDLHIDDHHTVEDSGIALGQAVAKALGDRKGIRSRPRDQRRSRDATLGSSGLPPLGLQGGIHKKVARIQRLASMRCKNPLTVSSSSAVNPRR